MKKLSKRDIRIIMIIFAVALFAANMYFLYMPLAKLAETARADTVELKLKYADLSAKEQSVSDYQTTVNSNVDEITEILSHYPTDILPEDWVAYMMHWRDDYKFPVGSLSFEDAVPLYTFTARVQRDAQPQNFELYSINCTLTLSDVSYGDLKTVLTDVYMVQTMITTLESVDISKDESTGKLTLDLTLKKFFLKRTDIEYTPPDITVDKYGNENPFRSLN